MLARDHSRFRTSLAAGTPPAGQPACAASPEPLLAAEGLSFAYGPRTVLRHCSLTLSRGEWVGLLGPNGAGKSTLLRLLAGLLTPAAGTVRLNGRPLRRLPRREVARQVGWLPQAVTAPDGLAVIDLVRLGRYPHLGPLRPEGPADREAVARALRLARAEELADRLFGELSGGERQRVMLARVLAQEPAVLLLDEPTASLDLRVQLELLQTLRQLVDGGLAILSALHDLDLAARFCDRLMVLAEGTILADGPPEAVLTPEILARAFAVEARVGRDPLTGYLHVAPVRPAAAPPP